jgi:ATP/maltotriose-dependent transcriptional regulator MalT
MERLCLACLSEVLLQTGEWDRAITVCRTVLASPDSLPPAPAMAESIIGSIQALRGQPRMARRLLQGVNAQAQQSRLFFLEMRTTWCLALVDELEGEVAVAAERCRLLRSRWEQTEDRHYAVPGLRWAASFFARHNLPADARASAHALADIAANTGNPEALAALAHALGECALLDGDVEQASRHFNQALVALSRLELPFWRAQTQVRAGVALAALGERDAAVERLTGAYRTARKLGARPLATLAAQELIALGEPVERRLGRRAVGDVERAGLSRREIEVLRLMSLGRANRDIAQELFVSPRTIEMHVSNILLKLNCATRLEAAHRARELQLVP